MKIKKYFIIPITIGVMALTTTYINPKPIEPPPPTPPIMINRVELLRNDKEAVQKSMDIHVMARVVDAVVPECDNNCRMALMQLIINRYNLGYADTIEGVCNMPQQWQGLTALSKETNATVMLARNYIEEPLEVIPTNMQYMCVESDGLSFRSNWNGGTEIFVPFWEGDA